MTDDMTNPLTAEAALRLNRLERGRALYAGEIDRYLADRQTPLRHGTADIGDEIAEQLRDAARSQPEAGLREAKHVELAIKQLEACPCRHHDHPLAVLRAALATPAAGLDAERLARALWRVRAGTAKPPRPESANWADQRKAAARIAAEYARLAKEQP